jgi:hypothetical protein
MATSMNFMVCDWSQGMGEYQCGMLRMSGCNRAMHVHVLGEHVHCSNHYGIVIIWG